LINAAPDLPAQIAAFPQLQPAPGASRNSPIAAVLVTNADLDHTLGLLSLREGGRLNVHATRAIRETLDRALGVTTILDSFCGVNWHEPPEEDFAALRSPDGSKSCLQYRAIGLPGNPPRFATEKGSDGRHVVAYQLVDRRTKGRLLVAPDVARVNEELQAAMLDSDAVLFDGTFWSGDELARVKNRAPSAAEMGHVTIKDGSLALLGSLPAARKIYIHINNTNPVLAPGSPERAAVEAAGIVVGFDGLEFEL
jgi:pyrroloquinoline quinone biosynthesis protein B